MKHKTHDAAIVLFALIVLVLGFFIIKGTITGMVVVSEERVITDSIDIAFNENTTHLHQLDKLYNVKSVRLSGYIIGEGSAKIYLQRNDSRYLIYDSGEEEGIIAVTGHAVEDVNISENETVEEVNETTPETPQESVNETPTEEPINETPIIEEPVIEEPIEELPEQLPEDVINETEPINQTPIEEPINETIPEEANITINLEYKSGTKWDPEDDGVEDVTGVIDFTVEDSNFNWDVDEDKLCTKWSINSVDNDEITVICFGSVDCCNFIGLGPTLDLWNDPLEMYYQAYGSTLTNKIKAQVIYYDETLDVLTDLSDIYYSSESSLDALFTRKISYFNDECKESCALDIEVSDFELIVEVENVTVNIDNITYTVVEERVNKAPKLVANVSNITIIKNKDYRLDLSEYFYDEDNDTLTYEYYNIEDISISIDNNIATIVPDENFTGTRFSYFTANDSELIAVSNLFEINVVEEIISEKPVINETINKTKVVINRPVKWVKKSSNKTIEIPEEASNISVNKIIDEEKISIEKNKIKIKHKGKLKDLDEFEASKKIKEIGVVAEFIVEENETEIIIEEEADYYEVEYETEGPSAIEDEISAYRKRIVVSSEINYTNVLAYTGISESPKDSIKLYWYKDGVKTDVTNEEDINLVFVDSNFDNLIDRLEWNVPHLSNQTFEVEIIILNVQSYPTLYGNWNVMFETTGRANLTITPVNTSFAEVPDDSSTEDDLEFLEVRCNDSVVNVTVVSPDGSTIPYSVYEIKRRIKEIKDRLEELK